MTENLSADLAQFLDDRVAAGKYASHEEVLRAAFALLEQREEFLARVDRGTAELRRGERKNLESDHDWEDFCDELIRRGTERNRRSAG